LVGEALRVSRRQTTPVYSSFTLLGSCEDYREREAVKLAVSREQFDRLKNQAASPLATESRSPAISTLAGKHLSPIGKFKQQAAVLNKTVFQNLYSHACLTVMFYLIAYDGAVDGGEPAVN
jgi:hypothetical protein